MGRTPDGGMAIGDGTDGTTYGPGIVVPAPPAAIMMGCGAAARGITIEGCMLEEGVAIAPYAGGMAPATPM